MKEDKRASQGTIDRAQNLASARSETTQLKIAALADLMRDKLSTGDFEFRKNYLRAIFGATEAKPDKVSMLGGKDFMQTAIGNENGETA